MHKGSSFTQSFKDFKQSTKFKATGILLLKFLITILCLFGTINVFSDEYHEFVGTHYLASYFDCDANALNDEESLEAVIKEACTLSGATVLGVIKHKFKPNGVTVLALLAESHASIHTYPDERACFVDFFTCGTSCDCKKFEEILWSYLKAEKICTQEIVRD